MDQNFQSLSRFDHSSAAKIIFSFLGALCFLQLNIFGNCHTIDIQDIFWKTDSSELEIKFKSKSQKLYELYSSDDLEGFEKVSDVVGTTGATVTTVMGSGNGLNKRFFRISDKNAVPAAIWFKEHEGGREESHGHYILECTDGGFLQVGETGIPGSNARILVVKTDSDGNVDVDNDDEWIVEFGRGNRNMGNSALEVADGYLICGMLSGNSAILKLNKTTGNSIFIETHDNGGIDGFEHMALTPSGILAVGFTRAEDAENTFFPYGQGHITFLDAEGKNPTGQSVNAYMSHAYRVKPTGSDYIISGTTEDAQQYAVIKIDNSGNVEWNKTYGGTNQDHCFGMDLAADGSIFLTGHTLSGTANWDTYTIKLDSDGEELWAQPAVRGNPRGFDPQWIHDETWGIKATCDGGCIISAGTGDEYPYSAQIGGVSSDQWEAYIVKYGANGKMQWEETFSSGDFDQDGDWAAEDIDLTSDGGAIIAIDNGKFGFLKLAPF